MNRRRRSYGAMANINITSLVDVTLCLLIIFMLTAPYIHGGVEVDLPEADTRTQVVREGPVISITENRQLYFQEDPVTMDEMVIAVKAVGRALRRALLVAQIADDLTAEQFEVGAQLARQADGAVYLAG